MALHTNRRSVFLSRLPAASLPEDCTNLTAELARAPHGAHLLEKVPVVGTLRDD
jgi:hypothetical protein